VLKYAITHYPTLQFDLPELYVAMMVHRIDVAEHALYRTRKANLDVLLGI